jgi:PAS domain S-box-containing protein
VADDDERNLKLDTARALFRVYDLAPVIYCTLSEPGLILQAYPSAAKLLGAACGELPGQPLARYILNEDQDIYSLLRKRLIETGDPQVCELRLLKPDGAQCWVQLVASTAQDAGGGPQLRIALSDVTGRKLAEQQRQHLIDMNPGVIYTCRTSGDFGATYVSEQVENMTGYKPQAFVGNASFWLDHVHPDDRETALKGLSALFEAGRHTHEYRFLHADGGYRWVHDRLRLARDAQDHAAEIVGMWMDITEQKQNQEALHQFAATLEEEVGARTRQLRALAAELTMTEECERRTLAQELHDNFAQLLAAIKIKLASIDLDSLESWVRDVEGQIDWAERSLRIVIGQLSPPILNSPGLGPILEWLAGDMERGYGIAVHVHDESAPKLLDETRRTIVYRCVRELLINVARHARVASAEVTCLADAGRLMVAVSDEGCGFDAANVLAARPCATGFGLLSIRERIVSFGGSMDIHSAPGEGSTIVLMLPLSGRTAEARAP